MAKIEHNIYKLYLIRFSKWFMLFMPVVALFYQENGLNDDDLFYLQAIYAVSTIILEIPSGYLADVWGRKNTIVLGSILGTAGFATYSIGHGFWEFAIAEIFLGIGGSFISGSDSALLFDSLQQTGKKNQYLKFEGRINSFGNIFETAAALLGGFLASYFALRSAYIGQTIISFIAIPTAFLLIEPARQKLVQKHSLKQIAQIAHDALFKNINLSKPIILSAVTGACTLTMAWVAQLFGKENNFTTPQMTLFWVGLNITVAASALFAHKISSAIKSNRLILLIIIVLALGYVGIPVFQFWSIPLMLLFYLARGIATPVFKDYINIETTSDVRATVLSVRMLIIRGLFAAIGPAIGYVSEKIDFYTSITMASIIFSILFLTSGLFFFRKK